MMADQSIDRVDAWRKMIEAGASDRVCDEIVRGRDVPPELLAAIKVDRPLPDRQLEVLVAAADGLSMVDTAAKLGLRGVQSVKSHRRKAVINMRARNVTHAVALAIRGGLI